MQERPILFSGEMVRAILEGRKTQTRRVIAPSNCSFGSASREFWEHGDFARAWRDGLKGTRQYLHVPCHVDGDSGSAKECARCDEMGWEETAHRLWPAWSPLDGWIPLSPKDEAERPPHRLWVREAFSLRHDGPLYKADYSPASAWTWSPSIHMPRKLSRINLEITKVRVERVQDISHVDANAEGCRPYCVAFDKLPAQEYQELWNKINADRGFGWEKNPWVWVLEFSRVL